MKTILLAPAVVSAFALCRVALQSPQFSAKSPDGDTVQVVAVCKITPDSASCWHPDGSPDPKDTEYVAAVFIANPDQKLQLRYRLKTRLLVTSEVARANGQSLNFNSIVDGSGRSLTDAAQRGNWRPGEENKRLFWYYPSESDSVVDLSIPVSTHVEETPKLDLKVGATAKIKGTTVKIDSIRPADSTNQPGYMLRSVLEWDVYYTCVPSAENAPTLQLYGSPFDLDGKAIAAVDAHGNPTKPKPNRGYQQIFYTTSTSSTGGRFRCAVNPDRVKYIVLNANYETTLSLTGIHLDPNPEKGG